MTDDIIIQNYKSTIHGFSRRVAARWSKRERVELAHDIEQAAWELILKRNRRGLCFSWLAVKTAMNDEGCRATYGVTRRAIKLSPRPAPTNFDQLPPRLREFLY